MAGTVVIHATATVDAPEATGEKRFRIEPAYSGGELRVAGFTLPVVVDLAGLKAAERVPAVLDHEPSRRVGHVEALDNDGRRLFLAGVVSVPSDASREFIGAAQHRFPWQASIEAAPDQLVDLPAGARATVNGRTFEGPIQIAKSSRLVGVAFVTRGADSTTKVLIAKGKKMEVLTELETLKAERLPGDSEIRAAAAANPIEGERLRVQTIHAMAGTDADWHENAEKVATLKASALEGKLSVDGFREALLDVIRSARPLGPAIHASTRDMNGQVIEAALCQTLKLSDAEERFPEQVRDAAHKSFRGRLGLQQLFIMAAAANGWRVRPGERLHRGNLQECLAFAVPAPDRRIEAGFSTLSLPSILSNVANNELLAGYQDEDQSWREVSTTKPVADFKQATSYRLLDSSEYELLPAEGRIKHGTLGEDTYTRQAKTYAKMFTLTRVDIINDNLGAFDDLRLRLGRGAARKFNAVFWASFLDNASFFTAGRGNYISGTDSVLDTTGTGLERAVIAFRGLRTAEADGAKRVSGKPEILLVPPELEFVARRLFQSTNINTGGAATETAVPDANIYQGLYRPVVVDQLSDGDFTGYSATAWYLFRSPTMLAPMVVSFLNGVEMPTVESADADFDQLGVSFRGYHDFGVDQAEYLAGVKSKGAA